MKKLNDLPKDIYDLFRPEIDHEVSEDNLAVFAEDLKTILRQRLREYRKPENTLRFSALGKPDRQVWYDHNDDGSAEVLRGPTFVKFLYGDLIEQLILFLAREAGHTVEGTQARVEIDGVTGSADCLIDGVLVDVKSASPFGYQKFAKQTVTEDDPFGYTEQLAGYATVLTPGEDAAWVAIDKVSGDICVSPLSKNVIKHYNPADAIARQKSIITSDALPPRCCDPIPDGKSGNMKLPTKGSYCKWKERCNPGLRTFLYSTGPRWLTHVARVPDIPEITSRED